ncbi:sulfite exporter TauE/SafE family protein [Cognatishimia maritima]|uniref:Probable membrane transporter protein n=1 Tax=Cognatishimia maritima TaxID=870908 RepID=A0A1M5L0B7_9RHOB|nr:sulfite exporter TauE/SafE family protein [Cognatishimia maritima]SHG58467.1 hypothetical protein SAMN04488044_1123 [Cognatishimia maritima]
MIALGPFTHTELIILAGAAFLASLVRGFSGFGSGLIYVPIAAQVLTPFQTLTTMVIFDLLGPIPLIRPAFRDCDKQDLMRLLAGLVVALPIGLFTLTLVAPEVFRYAVSLIAFFMLVCLIFGLRYRGTLSPPLIYGTGGLSGFCQGVAGLPGPPVILLYMASTLPAQSIRANTFLFLFATDVVLLPMLAVFGRLDSSTILLGIALILPTLTGSLIGARIFNPRYEKIYRSVAYTVIALSALSGLPLLD